jgi:hypothetical protein
MLVSMGEESLFNASSSSFLFSSSLVVSISAHIYLFSIAFTTTTYASSFTSATSLALSSSFCHFISTTSSFFL